MRGSQNIEQEIEVPLNVNEGKKKVSDACFYLILPVIILDIKTE